MIFFNQIYFNDKFTLPWIINHYAIHQKTEN